MLVYCHTIKSINDCYGIPYYSNWHLINYVEKRIIFFLSMNNTCEFIHFSHYLQFLIVHQFSMIVISLKSLDESLFFHYL